jgi:hypothetical protein
VKECAHCSGPLPCECWKNSLTPQERIDLQTAIVAKYLAKLDRVVFERKQQEYLNKNGPSSQRGHFGNRFAARRNPCTASWRQVS